MKLTLKTLKGQMINVQVEPDASIADVKAKVSQLKGFDAESQKIVYKGKPLVNTDTVSGLGIKQTDFLVLMNTIKKPESKPKQETVPNKQQSKPAPKPVEVKPQVKKQPTQNEAQITQLMGMGFQREKCIAALRAAQGNSQIAVDYLLNGIPSGAGSGSGQLPPTGNAQQLLRALMASPELQPIKQMLREDPTQINSVMEQIMATSPALYNLIAQNPQAFQKVLLEEDDFQGEQGEDIEGEEGEEGQGEAIHLTEAEDAAIKRLMGLGFTKIDAAQAYFACDKNQEMAANLLFDRQANGDLDLPGPQGGQGGQGEDDDDNLFN